MKTRVVNKRTRKCCPECKLQVPTACKTCNCGFGFKRNEVADSPPVPEGLRRRTGRIKKEPNYFSSLEYEHQFRRRKRSVSASSSNAVEESGRRRRSRGGRASTSTSAVRTEQKPVKEKSRLSLSKGVNRTATTTQSQGGDKGQKDDKGFNNGEDVYSSLPAEKALLYSIVLAEINRKFMGQSAQPAL